MAGKLVKGRTLGAPLRLECDAVVIGMGAGGSIALREIARAGANVIGLEAGPAFATSDFTQREDEMITQLFQDSGCRTTSDLAIRVIQGRGVGGSTIHNTNLCKRTPDEILEIWRRDHGVEGLGPAEMRAAFEQIESDLSVTEIPPAMRNANNEVLREGVEKLGWRGAPLKHNRVGCIGSGYCELGCSYNAKQNAMKVVVPQAIEAGATVYADVDVRRIVHDGKRVQGIEGTIRGEGGAVYDVTIRARVVVLGASAVGSAFLAKTSSLPDPHATSGKGLRLHPGAAIAGVFEREIVGYRGIPQSYECTEFLSFEPNSDRRAWIVTAFAHPIGTAATLPGFGAAHMAAMRKYNQLAVLTAMIHDETSGEVRVDGDVPSLRYELLRSDQEQIAKGIAASARILFAAGASEVIIPAIPPVRLKSLRELDSLNLGFVRPHTVPLTAVHPMGTLAMGADPKRSVVRSTGEHHHVKGLFVADGSLFPTSLGGPPQISIYAFAYRLAPFIIEQLKKG